MLRIVEVTRVVSYLVETDDGATYRRKGPRDWERLYGNSWELVHSEEESQMDALFAQAMPGVKP